MRRGRYSADDRDRDRGRDHVPDRDLDRVLLPDLDPTASPA
jgi:hypothetical protein